MLSDGSLSYVGPTDWVVRRGDWEEAERRIGTDLPDDYKNLIGDQGALEFADELVIASPFDEREHLNLLCVAARGSWAMAYLRDQSPDPVNVAIYPEPGGLLRWGYDGGGVDYFWACVGADPNGWTVHLAGRPVLEPAGHGVAVSLTGYLAGLAGGLVQPESLDNWPEGRSSVRPL